jgi:hypothetical protein
LPHAFLVLDATVWVRTSTSTRALIGAIGIAALSVFIAYWVHAYWVGNRPIPRMPRTGVTFGNRLSFAVYRSMLPMVFLTLSAAASLLVRSIGQLTATGLQPLYDVVGLVVLLAFLLWVCVGLFNVPRFLVPPAIRDAGGLFVSYD